MASRGTHLKRGDLLLGRYRIKAFLGSGGMSTVYLAEDLRANGEYLAVKESRMDPRWAHQLMIEAKMLGDLDHPHLPRIAGLFLSGDRQYFYIVQEYIEGITLSKRFQQNQGVLRDEELVDYMIQVCDVLQYLHDRKIVYKDLKPGNLMIAENHFVKLIDFGIARKYGDGKPTDHIRMGTVGFAAPEQIQGLQTDHRTDLYALGAMMLFLFSRGNCSVAGEKSLKPFRKPRKLTNLVGRLTREDPDARIQSAGRVRLILQKIQKRC